MKQKPRALHLLLRAFLIMGMTANHFVELIDGFTYDYIMSDSESV